MQHIFHKLTKRKLTRKKIIGAGALMLLLVGLFSALLLVRTRQDNRQQASTGDTVGLVFKATEGSAMDWSEGSRTIQTGRVLSIIPEMTPGALNATAADLILKYDPEILEFDKVYYGFTPYNIIFLEEANREAGLVRIAVGKNPQSTLLSSLDYKNKLPLLLFKVKSKLGASTVSLTSDSQIAAENFATNLLVPTSVQSYPFTVVPLSSTTDPLSVQLEFKLAGTPVENNPKFLTEAAQAQKVAVSLQNMQTGEVTDPIALTTQYAQNATNSANSYFTFVTPFKSTTLPTGKYNILVKGPKHQQIRFCKQNQSATDRCQVAEGIELATNTAYYFNLTKKPLACGDLPISGTNKDQQDGAVRVTDYSFMISCLSKRQDAACVARADCNGDGSVTNLDMDLLLETLSTAYDQ